MGIPPWVVNSPRCPMCYFPRYPPIFSLESNKEDYLRGYPRSETWECEVLFLKRDEDYAREPTLIIYKPEAMNVTDQWNFVCRVTWFIQKWTGIRINANELYKDVNGMSWELLTQYCIPFRLIDVSCSQEKDGRNLPSKVLTDSVIKKAKDEGTWIEKSPEDKREQWGERFKGQRNARIGNV